jgi:hypothetical protein
LNLFVKTVPAQVGATCALPPKTRHRGNRRDSPHVIRRLTRARLRPSVGHPDAPSPFARRRHQRLPRVWPLDSTKEDPSGHDNLLPAASHSYAYWLADTPLASVHGWTGVYCPALHSGRGRAWSWWGGELPNMSLIAQTGHQWCGIESSASRASQESSRTPRAAIQIVVALPTRSTGGSASPGILRGHVAEGLRMQSEETCPLRLVTH